VRDSLLRQRARFVDRIFTLTTAATDSMEPRATIKILAALYTLAPELFERTFDNIRGKDVPPPSDDAKW
jgi:hypothetical protein